MTDKEQQKIEIGKCVCNNYGDCKLDRLECPYSDCFADAVATEVIEKGYRKRVKKTIWHKVADGDLPKIQNAVKYYWCYVYDKVCNTKYCSMVMWTGTTFGINERKIEIIAWTELPEYKE